MSEEKHSDSKPANQHDSSWTNARSLNTREAREFSEWVLLVNDLEYALRRAHLWRDIVKSETKNEHDSEVCVSLFRDAVISLVACFDNTLSVHLDPRNVYNTIPGGFEYFQWLKDLRHSWVAHRSGPSRQCVAAILVDEQTGDFRGFGHLCHLYLGPKADASGDLVKVVEIALIHARKELDKHQSILKQKIEKMKNHERLRLPIAATVVASHKEIHMGRKKFQNIKRSSKRGDRS